MIEVISKILLAISFAFAFLYSYHLVFQLVAIFIKPKEIKEADKNNKIAVLIAARNESIVIHHLIESLKYQTYDQKAFDVYVIADNCTDNTAQIATQSGANVYERFNKRKVGKGYALEYLLDKIFDEKGKDAYDAYVVIDADNLLDKNYLFEMNKVFASGYDIITSFRNSKNFDDNWISAAYSLNFIRESSFSNHSRMILGTPAFVSGTGFMFSKEVILDSQGWQYFLLTEDIEFTASQILKNRRMAYAKDAILYDEQPTSMKESYHQRLRWAKGFIQVFQNYGLKLFKGIFTSKNKFGSFDMFVTLLPVLIAGVILPIFGTLNVLKYHENIIPFISHHFLKMLLAYLSGVYIALVVTIRSWDRIMATSFNKIRYCFTYPIFIMTYIPISIIALFKDVTWKPIKHTKAKSILEYKR